MLAILREQNTLKSIILILARPLHGFIIMDKLLNFPCGSAGKESTCNAGDPDSLPGSGRSTEEGIGYPLQYSWASLVAHLVNNMPGMWATGHPITDH